MNLAQLTPVMTPEILPRALQILLELKICRVKQYGLFLYKQQDSGPRGLNRQRESYQHLVTYQQAEVLYRAGFKMASDPPSRDYALAVMIIDPETLETVLKKWKETQGDLRKRDHSR